MEGFDDTVDVSNEEGEHAASPIKEDQHELNGNDSIQSPPVGSNDNAVTEGIFSSSNDGPLLPEPIHMQEESSAFREWRRYVHELLL